MFKTKGDGEMLTYKQKSVIDAIQDNNYELLKNILINVPENKSLKEILNFKDEYGNNPLHIASINTIDNRIMDILLENSDLDINERNDEGFKPIHLASINQNIATVKKLIINGADTENLADDKFSCGNFIEYITDKNAVVEIMYLIKDIEQKKAINENSINEEWVKKNIKDDPKVAEFLLAVCKGDIHKLELEMENGFDINSLNGLPLLTSIQNNNIEMAKVLINLGAEVNNPTNNALEEACEKENLDAIKFLIENGADIKVNDSKVIFDTVEKEKTKILNALLYNNSLLSRFELQKVLNICVDKNNTEIIDLLALKSFNIKDNGKDVLLNAIANQKIKSLEKLLDYKVSPNSNGGLPLKLALETMNEESVYHLVKAGADLYAKTFDGGKSFWDFTADNNLIGIRKSAKKAISDKFLEGIIAYKKNEPNHSISMM